MQIDFPEKFFIFIRHCVIAQFLLMGFINISVAHAVVKPHENNVDDMKMTGDSGNLIQLEVRQKPLGEVLNHIARKTGIPIHYSVLPTGLVTATCAGMTVKHVLDCLLAGKADLIVRYQQKGSNAESKSQIAEAWILGSKIEDAAANRTDCSVISSEGEGLLSLEKGEAEREHTAELLKMAKSKNISVRIEAIGTLLSGDHKDDPEVQNLLEQASHDADANIRAQAVSSLKNQEGRAASSAIEEAMHDNSVDVRMMAVDVINDDVELLRQALNDSDQNVRDFAALKLEELTRKNEGRP